MNGNKNRETFNYTYSSKTKSEIEKIRKKYLPEDKSEDKLETVRRLDASVTRCATVWALILGICGALIMGTGMCIIMTEFGAHLGLQSYYAYIVGIAIGLAGMAVAGIAYPVYSAVLKKKRAKVAPEIIRLTDELMK